MHHMRYYLVDGLSICHVPTNWSPFQMDQLLLLTLFHCLEVPSSTLRQGQIHLESVLVYFRASCLPYAR